MNQIQVFIILNVLPILLLAIVWLRYLKSENKSSWKKFGVVLCAVLAIGISYKSIEVHKILFPEIRPPSQENCVQPKKTNFNTISRNPIPTVYHNLFNVKVVMPSRPLICKE